MTTPKQELPRETLPQPSSAGAEEANERGRRAIKGMPPVPAPAAPKPKEE